MAVNYGTNNVAYIIFKNSEDRDILEDSINEEIEKNIKYSVSDDSISESEVSDKNRNCSKCKHVITGVLLSMISATIFTANNFLIKQFGVVISDLLIVRSVLKIIFLSFSIHFTGHKILQGTTHIKVLTIAQGLAGSISITSVLVSISFLPLPDVLCLVLLYPLTTIVLTLVFIGSAITSLHCFSFTFLTLGTIFVSQPSFLFPSSSWPISPLLASQPGLYTTGIVLACLACAAGGGMAIGVAQCQSVPVPVLAIWTSIFSLPLAIIINLLQSESCILSSCFTQISVIDWLLLLGLSLSGFLAFLLLVQAMQLLSPIISSSLHSLEIVMAYTAQLILYRKDPDTLTGVGMVLVVMCLITILLHDQIVNMWTVRGQPEYQPLIPDRDTIKHQNFSYTYIQ